MAAPSTKIFQTFVYTFFFDDGREIKHKVNLCEDGHSVFDEEAKKELEQYRPFTRLDNNKCTHCPLKIEEYADCPAAINLASVINSFKEIKTSEKVRIEVETSTRTFLFKGDLTKGLHAAVGLAMASSECPYMKFLRPMALFHLPFANSNETIVRAMSFHLLRSYFVSPEKGFEFDSLFAKYRDVETINQGMMERIRTFEVNDTGMHAIVILDSFISIFGLKYDNKLADIKKFFENS